KPRHRWEERKLESGRLGLLQSFTQIVNIPEQFVGRLLRTHSARNKWRKRNAGVNINRPVFDSVVHYSLSDITWSAVPVQQAQLFGRRIANRFQHCSIRQNLA